MRERNDIKRIAIYCLSGLGNIILFTPTLERLKACFPDAEIFFLTIRKANYEYVKSCPWVTPVFLEQRDYNSFWGNLRVLASVLGHRAKRFDLSIPVFPSNRFHYDVVRRLLGSRFDVCFDYGGSSDGGRRIGVSVNPALHDAEQSFAMLPRIAEKFGLQEKFEKPGKTWVWSDARQHERAEVLAAEIRLNGQQKIVAYHPVCFPDMAYKRWPEAHFAAVIDRFAQSADVAQVLLGARGDEEMLRSLAARCKQTPKIVCAEELGTVAALLSRCEVLISNDSGLMHLGTAAGTNTVGIFGPTRDSRTRPWGDNGYALVSPHPLRPCRNYPFAEERGSACCNAFECMRMVTPEMVLDFIREKKLLNW